MQKLPFRCSITQCKNAYSKKEKKPTGKLLPYYSLLYIHDKSDALLNL